MEFVKKSSAVTEVLIPEGDVIRITDKATGNILWEKGPRMEQIKDGLPAKTLWTCIDTGSNIFFANNSSDDMKYFTYTPSTQKSSAAKKFKVASYSGIFVYSIDMDTSSKTWLATVDGYGRDNDSPNNYSEYLTLENSNGKLTNSSCSGELGVPSWSYCCWMKNINSFCIVGGAVGQGTTNYTGVCSGLVSLQHKLTSFSDNCIPYNFMSP